MRIPSEIALWMQKRLLGLVGEDWSIGYVADGIPDVTLRGWQLGVDVIYRLLTSQLIAVDVFMECRDTASLLRGIRTVSPFEDLGGFLWNGTRVYGTKQLSQLVDAYFPPRDERDGKLNSAFIEALEQIFAKDGVPWSEKPLLPIMPSTAGAATQ